MEKALFGAGCFWGVEHAFRKIKGVTNVTVGYAGGHTANPTYQEVCSGRTGHAEVAQVEFDPAVVSYAQLVDFFWTMHDPTTLNRQGPDIGTQYRSAIFTYSPQQEAIARASRDRMEAGGKLRGRIATEITPAGNFTAAEEYHQQYLTKSGRNFSCH